MNLSIYFIHCFDGVKDFAQTMFVISFILMIIVWQDFDFLRKKFNEHIVIWRNRRKTRLVILSIVTFISFSIWIFLPSTQVVWKSLEVKTVNEILKDTYGIGEK